MRGFLKIQRNKYCICVGLVLITITLWGCSSSPQNVQTEPRESTLHDFLAKYEATFNPSDYDPDIATLKQEEQQQHNTIASASVVTTAVPETIQGFRIQILFTQEIDQATNVKDSLNILLPDDWVYVVYDAPYYKVRVGDYHERPEANSVLKKLEGRGYKGAWIVPDYIIKNPLPKPPDTFIIPERPLDQR